MIIKMIVSRGFWGVVQVYKIKFHLSHKAVLSVKQLMSESVVKLESNIIRYDVLKM